MDLLWINSETVVNVNDLNERVKNSNANIICLAVSKVWQHFSTQAITDQLTYFDAIHAGLAVGGEKLFEELSAVSLNWNFLSPDKNTDNYSWKASEHFFVFKKDVFDKIGCFNNVFSLTASIAEFSYRILRNGGLVKYSSDFCEILSGCSQLKTSCDDVIKFAAIHLSTAHARLIQFYFLLKLKIVFPSLRNFRLKENSVNLNGIILDTPIRSVSQYTAIIPTILRYDYIGKCIESLLKQDYPPKEIIVVDQTPDGLRQPNCYEPYIQQGLMRVFYLDEPGQCTARNVAIAEAKTEWLLFFEDDTEAWPGMMRAHKYLMEHSLADVSTGVSLAPWKDESYIPDRNRKYQLSDVLATGNSFMKKQTALAVNGLHPAFDKGPGADDDFGRRLFLNGKLIVLNHKAIQTHHKASVGGMRVHGAWWRISSSSIIGAFPPVTQTFVIRNYYPAKFRLFHLIVFFIQAKKTINFFQYLMMLFLAPLKVYKSLKGSSELIRKFTPECT